MSKRSVLSLALALSLLAGCGPKTPAGTSSSAAPGSSSSQPDKSGDASSGGDNSGASGPSIRFMALSGPTGVGAAKLMALTVYELLKNQGEQARRVIDDYQPVFTQEEYVDFVWKIIENR